MALRLAVHRLAEDSVAWNGVGGTASVKKDKWKSGEESSKEVKSP